MEAKRIKQRIMFAVLVEVEAFDGEATIIAEAACGWPGDWAPPHFPVEVEGTFADQPVSARIIRSQALMIKKVD